MFITYFIIMLAYVIIFISMLLLITHNMLFIPIPIHKTGP